MANRPTRPLVIAHRGASAYRPENTPSAYRLAIEQGADMIEIDLHRCRDGAIVVAHDADLSRLGAAGEIGDLTLAEIRQLDAGEGQRVPTLDEVLDEFGPQRPFNLELKTREQGVQYEGLAEVALRAVSERGLLAKTLFSSFEDVLLEQLRGLSGEVRLATLVTPQAPDAPLERARAVGAEAVNPHFGMADADFVEAAQRAGLSVYVYTVDEEEAMRRLMQIGVDGLFTNRPDAMRALVAS